MKTKLLKIFRKHLIALTITEQSEALRSFYDQDKKSFERKKSNATYEFTYINDEGTISKTCDYDFLSESIRSALEGILGFKKFHKILKKHKENIGNRNKTRFLNKPYEIIIKQKQND